jgi:hypothetical protein
MQHPEEGIIHAWLDGALAAEEAAQLESHVGTCVECAERVAAARGLIAATSRIVGHLDIVPGSVIPAAAPAKRSYWLRTAWPAAIAASLIVAIGLYGTKDKQQELAVLPDSAPVARDRVEAVTSTAMTPPPAAPLTVRPSPERPVSRVSRARQQEVFSADSVSLPPAMAASQKSVATASAPAAATIPSTQAAAPALGAVVATEMRADSMSRVDSTRARTTANRQVASGGGGGGRGGSGTVGGTARAATGAVAQQRDFAMVDRARSEAVQAALGCYELNTSTDVLPARFALTADSAAASGLFAIRYLEDDGRLAPPIVDLGWVPSGREIVVRNATGRQLLTFLKTGSTVTGDSPNGPRSGRVFSCR